MKPSRSDSSLHAAVAKKVLTESLAVKKGESVTIESWSNSLPLALAFSKEVRKMGAIPVMLFEDETGYVESIRVTPKEFLGAMGKHEYGLLAATDAYVFLPGPPIAAFSRKVTRQEYIDSTRYNESWYKAAEKAGLRGARLTSGYLGEDIAWALGRTVPELVEHHLNAALVDFKAVGRKAREVGEKLSDGKQVAITAPGTDIKLTLKGELEIQDGRTDSADVKAGNNVCYVPPGFVYKDIDQGSVNGRARLSPTLTRFGLLKDAELVIKEGKITHWKSKGSPEVLKALGEAIPEKSRVIYAVTIGISPAMKFGFGQDRFPAGSVGLVTAFTGILRKATLKVGPDTLVKAGSLK